MIRQLPAPAISPAVRARSSEERARPSARAVGGSRVARSLTLAAPGAVSSPQIPCTRSGDGGVVGAEIPQGHEQGRADCHVVFVIDISGRKDLEKTLVIGHLRFPSTPRCRQRWAPRVLVGSHKGPHSQPAPRLTQDRSTLRCALSIGKTGDGTSFIHHPESSDRRRFNGPGAVRRKIDRRRIPNATAWLQIARMAQKTGPNGGPVTPLRGAVCQMGNRLRSPARSKLQ
jgi:hypothetical protein